MIEHNDREAQVVADVINKVRSGDDTQAALAILKYGIASFKEGGEHMLRMMEEEIDSHLLKPPVQEACDE